MSKQEIILKECLIAFEVEDHKKHFKRNSEEERLKEVTEGIEKLFNDKETDHIVKAIYSAMDKYHNSFLRK